jgi:hypothetical protein
MRISVQIATVLQSTGMVTCELAVLPGQRFGVVAFDRTLTEEMIQRQMPYLAHGMPPLAVAMLRISMGDAAILVQRTSIDFARLLCRVTEDAIRAQGIEVDSSPDVLFVTPAGILEVGKGEPN